MESLRELVQKYFPDEQIYKEANVHLNDKWIAKGGRLPIGAANFFYLKSIPMIETDTKYYFDKRVPLLFQSIISIFTGPLWLVGFLLIVQALAEFRYPIEVFIAAFVLAVFVGVINTFINKNSILNVVAINKSWVDENYEENNKVVLKGAIPTGGESYFLYSHVPEEKLDNKIIKKLPKKTYYNVTFTLKYYA